MRVPPEEKWLLFGLLNNPTLNCASVILLPEYEFFSQTKLTSVF